MKKIRDLTDSQLVDELNKILAQKAEIQARKNEIDAECYRRKLPLRVEGDRVCVDARVYLANFL